MKLSILFFLTLFNVSVYAQQLNFKVVNAETLKGLPEAQVKVSNKVKLLYTDATGLFSLYYTKGDTISIYKDGYHSLHIIPIDINLDTGHVITISMVPGSDAPGSPKSLQGFEYNFVHTTQPSNQLKAQVVESPDVTQKRSTTYFKIASMNLNNYKLESKQQKQLKAMDAAE